jgi:DNA-binding transcriptional MerR regulator
MSSNNHTSPDDYMTVGEIARKMGVTVRTMQYYDKTGLLMPSAKSEGGRRLYTSKDIIRLHQIQSMKYLGFSLEEIKNKLPTIHRPEEVSAVLSEQISEVKEKINTLTGVLESLEKLNTEVKQMDEVNWAAYADIILLLQSKSELYWARKHFSDKTVGQVSAINENKIKKLMEKQNNLLEEAEELQKMGIAPESKIGQAFARNYWYVTMELMENDTSLLPELVDVASKYGDSKWKSKQGFIEKALDCYLKKQKNNPFKEEP